MAFFYSEQREPYTGSGDLSKLNAVKGYLRHYDNLLFLTFMSQKGTFQEKAQALKELPICERKLKWWQNHPNYERDAVLRGIEALKRAWTI
jgi:hypothetical protein